MIGIYKFHWDCGRMGNIDSVFLADSEAVKAAIGKQVYFGEVLGKHSEIYAELDEEDIKLVSDNEDYVRVFCDLDLATGLNPLGHLNED